VKHVSEVVNELRREQVKTDSCRANESQGDRENGFECHRRQIIRTGAWTANEGSVQLLL